MSSANTAEVRTTLDPNYGSQSERSEGNFHIQAVHVQSGGSAADVCS